MMSCTTGDFMHLAGTQSGLTGSRKNMLHGLSPDSAVIVVCTAVAKYYFVRHKVTGYKCT